MGLDCKWLAEIGRSNELAASACRLQVIRSDGGLIFKRTVILEFMDSWVTLTQSRGKPQPRTPHPPDVL